MFDKKYCDVCGEKIGLLGNRKLEDGNLCKNCAKKLSPWFSERRHSSIDEIKTQLAYREENKKKVELFRATRTIGDYWRVLFDENHRWFTVTMSSAPELKENPDILDYSSITGSRFDIDENRNEIYRQNADGKNESYDPPRYRYSYNFDFVINIDNPYFNEIKFRLNCGSVEYEPQQTVQISLFGRSFTNNGANPENCYDYCKYRDMGRELSDELDRARSVSSSSVVSEFRAAAPAPSGVTSGGEAWSCAGCGTQNSGKFCENCGSPRPASAPSGCPSCGWKPEPGQNVPKFCSECGTQIQR